MGVLTEKGHKGTFWGRAMYFIMIWWWLHEVKCHWLYIKKTARLQITVSHTFSTSKKITEIGKNVKSALSLEQGIRYYLNPRRTTVFNVSYRL